MKIIAEYEGEDQSEHVVTHDDDGTYTVKKNGISVQYGHDAEGIIRYLAHCLHNANYKIAKLNKEREPTEIHTEHSL